MAYTPATKFPTLTYFQWQNSATLPRLASPAIAADTTLYFNVAPVDHSGAVITSPFVLGIKKSSGLVESVYCPNGANGVSGLSATGVIRGIRLEGLDFTTSDAALATGHDQDEEVFCNITGVLAAIQSAVNLGTLATGGSGLIMGTDALGTVTISRSTGVGTNLPWLRWFAGSTKVQFTDDGTTWINNTDVTTSVLFKNSALDTTPGYLTSKAVAGANITLTTLNPAGNEQTSIAAAGTLASIVTDVTSSAAELNKLDNTSANVTATNLNTLTAGIASNADALHTHTIAGSQSLTAGEAFTGATAPQPACIGSTAYIYQPLPSVLTLGTTGAALNVGDVDATTRAAFKLTVTDALAVSMTVANIKISVNKNAAPVDDTYFELQTDTAGSPSGVVVADGTTGVIAGGTHNTVNKFLTYTFATPPTIVSGTTYWAVFKRSGANNAGNYYQVQTKANTSAFAGNSKTYTSSTGLWADAGTQISNLTTINKNYGGRVFLSDADNKAVCRCDGFAISNAVAAGNSVTVQPTNIVSGLSSLTPGKMQYISTGAGNLTESPAADTNAKVVVPVGKAFSATSLNFTPRPLTNRGTLSTLTFAGAVANTTDFFIETGFRPSYVRLGVYASETGATPLFMGSITAVEGNENQEFHITKMASNGDGNVGTGVTGIIIGTTVGVVNDLVSVGAINDNGFYVTYTSNTASSNITTLDWVAIGN